MLDSAFWVGVVNMDFFVRASPIQHKFRIIDTIKSKLCPYFSIFMLDAAFWICVAVAHKFIIIDAIDAIHVALIDLSPILIHTKITKHLTAWIYKMENDFLSTDTILKLSHDCAFIYDEHGIIEELNSVAVKTLGVRQEEILGKNISNFIGDGYFPNHHKPGKSLCGNGDNKIEKKIVNLVKDKNKKHPCQYSLRVAPINIGDGWRYCAFATESRTSYPIIELNDNHDVVIDEEITINKQDMLDGIMEASIDAAFIINDLGIIKTVNEFALQKFGWNREEFI